jgi:tRNA G18 (ribose-2'-O)-methylase SpoU
MRQGEEGQRAERGESSDVGGGAAGSIDIERVPFRATQLAAAYDGARPMPVSVMLDNVRSMYNTGSFFRTADGAAVERLYLSGITARPPKNAIAKTALGAEDAVPWVDCRDALSTIRELRARGYEIAAIETAVTAVDVFDWRPRWPVLLLFGHEVEGVSAELLAQCDTFVRIPMLGAKHSLNVASAGAVVLYELLRKFRGAGRL